MEKIDKLTWAECQAQAIWEPRLKQSLDKGWCQSKGDPVSGLTFWKCGQEGWGFGEASHDMTMQTWFWFCHRQAMGS